MFKKLCFLLCFIFFLCSCKSTELPGNTGTASEVRSDLSELQSSQSETGITGERLAGTVKDGKSLNEELERILNEIRKQSITDWTRKRKSKRGTKQRKVKQRKEVKNYFYSYRRNNFSLFYYIFGNIP